VWPFVVVFGRGAARRAGSATPLAGAWGRRVGWWTSRGRVGGTRAPSQRTGGVALFAAFMAALLLGPVAAGAQAGLQGRWTRLLRVFGCFLGCTFLFIVGLIDDRRRAAARPASTWPSSWPG